MFDKPFEQLFRALQRIESQLAVADHEQKEILRDELIALRSLSDRFVEKWLLFEEKVADISDFFSLDIESTDINVPFGPIDETYPYKKKATISDEPDVSTPPIMEAMSEDPQIVRSFRAGLGYFDLLMFPDAVRELERVIEYDGDFAIARLYLALGYYGKGDIQKASQQLQLAAIGQSDPLILAVIHNTFGHILANQKEHQKAAAEFKQTVAYMGDFKDAYFNLGVCQYNLGDYQEALASFTNSLELDSDDFEAQQMLSLIWKKLGELKQAYKHIEAAYRLNSSDYKTLMLYAELSQQMGNHDLAKAIYKRAKRYYPKRVEPLGGIGWLELQAGRVNTAIAIFKKQLSLEPNHPLALFSLGWVSMQAGDTNKAKKIFSMMNSLFPDLVWGKIGLARLYQIGNELEKASDLLEQVTQSKDNLVNGIGFIHSGKFALSQGNYQLAVKHLAKALEIDPTRKEVWYFKAIAHKGLGEDELANHCFTQCES